VGRRSASVLEGARQAGFTDEHLFHFDDADAAANFLIGFIRPGDVVLVKASHGIRLDKVIERLTENAAGGRQ